MVSVPQIKFTQRIREVSECIVNCSYTSGGKDVDESFAIEKAKELIYGAGIIYVIGNGGSAGIASHFSNDLMKALKIPSQTLFDSNLLTCLANDYGYDQIFSYPLQQYMKAQDLLVAISSSGKSPSILNAVKAAQDKGASVITLSGFLPTNPLRECGALNFYINKNDYGLVEMAHFCLLHTMIDTWNQPKDSLHASTHRTLCLK